MPCCNCLWGDSTVDDQTLDRECSVFSIYLVGEPPSEYVKKKYRAAHKAGFLIGIDPQPAEDFLVRVASIAPWSTKMTDVYTRLFHPYSTLRRKLILLLAILETCAPSYARVDSADASFIGVLLARLAIHFLTYLVILVLGIFLMLPVDWLLRGKAKYFAVSLGSHG